MVVVVLQDPVRAERQDLRPTDRMLPVGLGLRVQQAVVALGRERAAVAEAHGVAIAYAGIAKYLRAGLQRLAFLFSLVIEGELGPGERPIVARCRMLGEGLKVRSQSPEGVVANGPVEPKPAERLEREAGPGVQIIADLPIKGAVVGTAGVATILRVDGRCAAG